MPFPASPLPDWQVLGADRWIPVPPTPAPSPAQLAGRPVTTGGGWNHSAWPHTDASQHTRPDRLRRALPPPPSEASLGPLRPAQARVLRPPPRKSLVPDPGQRTGRTAASTPPPPRGPVGRCLQLADAFVPPRGIGTQPPRRALGTMCCRFLRRRPRAPRRARTDDDRTGVTRLGAQDSAATATAATATSGTALSPSAHTARAASLTPDGPGLPGLSAAPSANHNAASLPAPAPRPPPADWRATRAHVTGSGPRRPAPVT